MSVLLFGRIRMRTSAIQSIENQDVAYRRDSDQTKFRFGISVKNCIGCDSFRKNPRNFIFHRKIYRKSGCCLSKIRKFWANSAHLRTWPRYWCDNAVWKIWGLWGHYFWSYRVNGLDGRTDILTDFRVYFLSTQKTNISNGFDPSRVTTAEPTNLIISRMSEESSLAELLDQWRSGMNRTINSPATLFRWSVRRSEYVVELIEDNAKNQRIITSLKKVSSDRNSSLLSTTSMKRRWGCQYQWVPHLGEGEAAQTKPTRNSQRFPEISKIFASFGISARSYNTND